MKITKKLIPLLTLLLITTHLSAQMPDGVIDEGEVNFNHIKLNLPGAIIRNYSLQYERVLTKRGSLVVSLRYMPEGKIPFQSQLKKSVANEDATLQETVDKLRISNFAFTPEYRFYLGRGYGKGFYIAPFYRYATFKSNNILINYSTGLLSPDEYVNLSGDLNSHTLGVLFGAQWLLGKNITLDWQILGPHFGSGKGDFTGFSSRTLSESDQQRVREELEALDIPFTKKTITTNAQGATMKLDGPWGGIRTGLSLGINF